MSGFRTRCGRDIGEYSLWGSPLQQVQRDRYDPSVKFRDPISAFNDVTGYSLNARFLATAFDVDFKLLDIGIVGPENIVARWSMEAKSRFPPLLPWKPTAVFTGTAEYKIDPVSGLITEHVDKWDSVEDNEFLSLEAIQYILSSLSQVLRRFCDEVISMHFPDATKQLGYVSFSLTTANGAFVCHSLMALPACASHCAMLAGQHHTRPGDTRL